MRRVRVFISQTLFCSSHLSSIPLSLYLRSSLFLPHLATTMLELPHLANSLSALPHFATTSSELPHLATTTPELPQLATALSVLPHPTTALPALHFIIFSLSPSFSLKVSSPSSISHLL